MPLPGMLKRIPMLINMNAPRVWGSVFAELVTRSSVLV